MNIKSIDALIAATGTNDEKKLMEILDYISIKKPYFKVVFTERYINHKPYSEIGKTIGKTAGRANQIDNEMVRKIRYWNIMKK